MRDNGSSKRKRERQKEWQKGKRGSGTSVHQLQSVSSGFSSPLCVEDEKYREGEKMGGGRKGKGSRRFSPFQTLGTAGLVWAECLSEVEL